MKLFFRIIFPMGCQTEKHIRPHHRLISEALRNFRHTPVMTEHDVHTVFVAIPVQMGSKPQHMRLIHAYVNSAALQVPRHLPEHFPDEIIGLFLIRQKDIVDIPYPIVFFPAQHALKMSQRLYTGNQFYSEKRRIGIHFPEFFPAVCSPPISEIRLSFYFIGILRIELDRGIAHQCQISGKILHRSHRQHTVAGTVQHNTQILIGGLLPAGKAVLHFQFFA